VILMTDPTPTKFAVRGCNITVMRGGSGRPLLFLHGGGGARSWRPFMADLATRHDVIVPEHPGFGASDTPDWLDTIPDLASFYLDFLDQLDLDNVDLVGFSLGGWIAAEIAARNTSRIRSLTLIAPAGLRVKGLLSGDNFIWSPEEYARNLFYDQAFAERELAHVPSEQEADIALTNRYMATKLGWEPRWFNPALERWLHRVRVPTLVLWGRDDKLFPSAYAKAWAERIPDTRVDIIPECGHRPHVEKADVVAQKILDFIGGRK
jgi:pimeloyl-ACP methyl ester carboxylesterase